MCVAVLLETFIHSFIGASPYSILFLQSSSSFILYSIKFNTRQMMMRMRMRRRMRFIIMMSRIPIQIKPIQYRRTNSIHYYYEYYGLHYCMLSFGDIIYTPYIHRNDFQTCNWNLDFDLDFEQIKRELSFATLAYSLTRKTQQNAERFIIAIL